MRTRVLREGLLVGLLAYGAVAGFYAVFDFLASRGVLYTLNMLGIAVIRGVRDPAILQLPVPLDGNAMVLYNAIHLVLSLGIGLTVVGLIQHAERFPARGRGIFVVVLAGFVVTILAVGLLSRPIRPVLPWWSIVAANSAAVILAAQYLLHRHPGIWSRLTAAEPHVHRPGSLHRSGTAPQPPSSRH